MNVTFIVRKSERGFERVDAESYANDPKMLRLVGQSSAIGDYEDSYDRPGTSYLWIGEHHHLNREQVGEYVALLQNWLQTGSLNGKETKAPPASSPPPLTAT